MIDDSRLNMSRLSPRLTSSLVLKTARVCGLDTVL